MPDYLSNVSPYSSHSHDEKRIGRLNAQREWAVRFFLTGKGNQENGTRGTLWAAYNGVTEYIDHCMGRQQTRQVHLNRVWFGAGCDIKVRAYRVAELLARTWRN